ncbi:MAG: tRNA lysidine(34) synthetase TilS [Hyphomicrobiales bacterium]|nr:tRNA lysidine(34) synthetase TilS [Hyphomicrobiales bacterium]
MPSASRDASPTCEEFEALMRPLEVLRTIALGVSGGADSMSLLLLSAHWRKRKLRQGQTPPEIIVFSVDHGVRATAGQEAENVVRTAKEHGCRGEVLRIEEPPPRQNKQAALRERRYALLCRRCREENIDVLLLAHHLEDQAETFLLRLARGSGVDGLASMSRESMRHGVRLYRPLLEFPRARLRAYLEQENVAWLEDPSNRDASYARVRWRKLLEPLAREGLDANRLAKTARSMARARTALEETSFAHLRRYARLMEAGYANFSRDLLRDAPDEIVLRSLSRLLMAVGGRFYAPRLSNLEHALESLRESPRTNGKTLGGCKIFSDRQGEGFFVIREPAAAASAAPVRLNGAGGGENFGLWDGRFRVFSTDSADSNFAENLEVRALGEEGASRCGASAERLRPALIRYGLPALWREGELVGAPHLATGHNLPVRFVLNRPRGLETSTYSVAPHTHTERSR